MHLIKQNCYQVVMMTKKQLIFYNGLDIMQFNNKVVGIIGMGRLGKMIEEYCYSFGMKVIYSDINKQKSSITPARLFNDNNSGYVTDGVYYYTLEVYNMAVNQKEFYSGDISIFSNK